MRGREAATWLRLGKMDGEKRPNQLGYKLWELYVESYPMRPPGGEMWVPKSPVCRGSGLERESHNDSSHCRETEDPGTPQERGPSLKISA
jgi:hypothetical protein